MVRIDRVTTRGGDGGETSLGDGARVRKDAPRIVAVGAVDEANATIGLLRLHTAGTDADAMLARIQNDLFDVGADLCVPGQAGDRLRLNATPVLRLEAETAAMNAGLPKLTSFVLPGGTPGAAYAHLARTTARHAERTVVALAGQTPAGETPAGETPVGETPVNPEIVRYLNRLSDHLFVLARTLNAGADVLWQPGANR